MNCRNSRDYSTDRRMNTDDRHNSSDDKCNDDNDLLIGVMIMHLMTDIQCIMIHLIVGVIT